MSSKDDKLDCLMILSASKPGNSFISFIESYKLLSAEFNVHIATPNAGTPYFFKNCDSQSRAFSNEFTVNTCANLLNLSTVDPEKYSVLVIPHCPGAVIDLAEDLSLGRILLQFVQCKKPICAIGIGVVGLFPAFERANTWCFRRFKLTAITVFELTSHPDFDKLNIIPEDVIKERGGIFTSSNDTDSEGHVEVDRFVITGQNERSTTSTIQSFLSECKQRISTYKPKS